MSGACPMCGYKISKARCFNCDYKERGSDGPWAENETNQALIWKAENIWDTGDLLSSSTHASENVLNYLAQRRIIELALSCDQLRRSHGLNRIIRIRSGAVLLARIWHVHKGFIGIHVTRIEWVGGDRPYRRDDRCTVGACQGGAVWFGTVTPETELVVGEGIETTLSAMILWGAKAGAATLGTSGLRSLVLPQAARRVVIAADNDAPVYKDLKKLPNGMDAARAARRLWLGEDPSIEVEIKLAPPPKENEDSRDWNDVLMESENVR
jgi:Toprim domain